MKSLTYPGRQLGYKAMEDTLTPLARAMRRFGAGKPSLPKNTPLAVVLSATEQRDRLRQKLDSEPTLDTSQIEAVASSANQKHQVSAGVKKRFSQMTGGEMQRAIDAAQAEFLMSIPDEFAREAAAHPGWATKIRDNGAKVKALEGK